MKPKILIVDDDKSIIKFVKGSLDANGYASYSACDGKEALDAITRVSPDLVLLDIMMPTIDGYDVCRQLRDWSEVPVIMISALCDENEKVKCLNLGADDYLCKPFGLEELLARIQAVLRRSRSAIDRTDKPNFTSKDLEINFATRQVTIGGREIYFTPTEYAILRELGINSPKVLTYQLLLKTVWGVEYGGETQYLHVYFSRLRKKLEGDPSNPTHLLSIRGIGYKLV
jgi:two-component system KDP operon response regulator KdpE